MSAPPPGRREEKKRRTKERLEAEGIRLFLERGFDNTTVDEIAAAAWVSTRTFFRYFASKEELLFCHLDEYVDFLRAELASRPPQESRVDAVRASILALAEFTEQRDEQVRDTLRVMLRNESVLGGGLMRQRYARISVAHVLAERDGGSEPDLGGRLLAGASLDAFGYALEAWVTSEEATSLVTETEGAFTALREQLAPAPS